MSVQRYGSEQYKRVRQRNGRRVPDEVGAYLNRAEDQRDDHHDCFVWVVKDERVQVLLSDVECVL